MVAQYLKLMRVHHYIKNLLVFAALACSGQLLNTQKLRACIIGFFVFCMVSSAVYILNDINDVERDRQHPTKRNRPIASGAVPVRNAWVLLIGLLVIAMVINLRALRSSSIILVLLYFALNVGYSLGLKNIPLLDLSILVLGFLIRVIYGAVITDIAISNWLYLTVIAMSFYFALGKRRNEIRQIGGDGTRKVLRLYTESFLDKNMYMCLTLANVFYALWSMDSRTVSQYQSHTLVFTVPIVLLISMKYSLDIEGESDGDPVEVLTHDRILMLLCVVYVLTMLVILYL